MCLGNYNLTFFGFSKNIEGGLLQKKYVDNTKSGVFAGNWDEVFKFNFSI